jgi:pilus assembly protein CpaB
MKRRMALVAAAVALALIGTIAVFAYVHGADKRAVAGTKASRVYVAHKQVPAGTSWADAVKDGYLSTENVPASATPESAVSPVETDMVDSAVASSDIASGQIVLHEMFGLSQSSKTGAVSIPKGMIAITVTMASNADVAGFPVAGSQIAVFGTFAIQTADGKPVTGTAGTGQFVTHLLLPKVLVLATSQAAPTTVDPAKDSTNTVAAGGSVLVTIAVSQADAQKIILSQQIGALYFGLLSDSSTISGDDAGVTNSAVLHPAPLIAE